MPEPDGPSMATTYGAAGVALEVWVGRSLTRGSRPAEPTGARVVLLGRCWTYAAAMVVLGLVLTGVAALLHVYIFWMESLAWTTPRVMRTFGVRTREEAETTRLLAFNQGFYNLFLAVSVGVGTVLMATGRTAVGATLVFAGSGSMAAAALVLLLSGPGRARSAAVQGTAPLLGVLALAVGLAS